VYSDACVWCVRVVRDVMCAVEARQLWRTAGVHWRLHNADLRACWRLCPNVVVIARGVCDRDRVARRWRRVLADDNRICGIRSRTRAACHRRKREVKRRI
jgi:hypothetical protein